MTGGTVGVGTDDPSCALEVRSSLAAGERSTGILSRSLTTQSTNANKALRVQNNSDTDTFSVSFQGEGYFAGLTQHAAGVTSNGVNLFDGSSIAPPGSGSVYASDFKFGGTGYTSENLTNVRSRINVDVGTNANLYCF